MYLRLQGLKMEEVWIPKSPLGELSSCIQLWREWEMAFIALYHCDLESGLLPSWGLITLTTSVEVFSEEAT